MADNPGKFALPASARTEYTAKQLKTETERLMNHESATTNDLKREPGEGMVRAMAQNSGGEGAAKLFP